VTPILPGDAGDLSGIQWRAVQGNKRLPDGRPVPPPGDVVLQLRAPQWRSVPMPLGFLMADLFYDNEDRLFPPDWPGRHYDGGERYLSACVQAAYDGWQSVTLQLGGERASAQARRDATAHDRALEQLRGHNP